MQVNEINKVDSKSAIILSFLNLLDQTPTPTRFLKNCEEVGLFNELASPFENDFKKASEDDVKKVTNIFALYIFQ